VLRVESKVEQGIVVLTRDKHDIAAATSVTAAGTATGYELLPAKRETSVAAVAGPHSDENVIYEHVDQWTRGTTLKNEKAASASAAASSGNFRCLRRWCVLANADELAKAAAIARHDDTRDTGKKCVILAETDVLAGFVARAPLPHENRSAAHHLTCERLDSEPLCI
jgi:hypothetical protein